MKGKIQTKAVLGGLCAFVVLYGLYFLAGNLLRTSAVIFLLQPLVWLVSGYITGILAKQHGGWNALMVGLATPFALALGISVVTLDFALGPQSVKTFGLPWFVTAVLLTVLGGLISDAQRWLIRKIL